MGGVVDSESPGELSPALAQPELVQINKIQGFQGLGRNSARSRVQNLGFLLIPGGLRLRFTVVSSDHWLN